MPNIKPISDLRNYTEVLHDVAVGAPVFLTKNGRGRYAIVDMQDYERTQATLRLMNERWGDRQLPHFFTEFLTTMSMWIVCSTAAGIIFASSLEMCRTTKQTNRDNLLHREKRFVTGTVCRDAGGFFYGRHIKIWTAIQR